LTIPTPDIYDDERPAFEAAKLRWPRGIGERKGVYETRVFGLMRLAEHLKPGDKVTMVMRHRSTSGMYRAIDFYIFRCDTEGNVERQWLSRWIAMTGVGRWDDKREAVGMSGAGMDMGFAAVYEVGSMLFRGGWECTGERCPSNDHSNGMREYGEGITHRSGGYALKYEWLS
jgi:hypothetical protein